MNKDYMLSFEAPENEKLYQDIKARLIEELGLQTEKIKVQKGFDYKKFADTFNKVFAEPTQNPRCEVLNAKRKRAILKAWNYDTKNENENLRTDSHDYWQRYFKYCSEKSFFTKERNGEYANWRPDFDFMIRESTHTGAREGKYQ